jgi:hypothetical protein
MWHAPALTFWLWRTKSLIQLKFVRAYVNKHFFDNSLCDQLTKGSPFSFLTKVLMFGLSIYYTYQVGLWFWTKRFIQIWNMLLTLNPPNTQGSLWRGWPFQEGRSRSGFTTRLHYTPFPMAFSTHSFIFFYYPYCPSSGGLPFHYIKAQRQLNFLKN